MRLKLAALLLSPWLHAAPAAPPAKAPLPAKATAKAALPKPAEGVAEGQDFTEEQKALVREAMSKATREKGAPASHVAHFTWDVPEKVDVVEVPGVLKSDGIPMRLTAVRTRMKLDDLTQHIYRTFLQAGLYVPEAAEQVQLPRVPMMTALDPEALISYTAVFQPNPDGTTTVVLGEAHLGEREQSPSGFDFAPLFPGAADVVKSDAEGLRSMSFTARATSEEVQRFYREVLGKDGARELTPGSFQKGSRLLRVVTRPLEGGKLAISVSERLGTAEESASTP